MSWAIDFSGLRPQLRSLIRVQSPPPRALSNNALTAYLFSAGGKLPVALSITLKLEDVWYISFCILCFACCWSLAVGFGVTPPNFSMITTMILDVMQLQRIGNTVCKPMAQVFARLELNELLRLLQYCFVGRFVCVLKGVLCVLPPGA